MSAPTCSACNSTRLCDACANAQQIAYCHGCELRDVDTEIDLTADPHAVIKGPYNQPTGEILCEGCRERRLERAAERALEQG